MRTMLDFLHVLATHIVCIYRLASSKMIPSHQIWKEKAYKTIYSVQQTFNWFINHNFNAEKSLNSYGKVSENILMYKV